LGRISCEYLQKNGYAILETNWTKSRNRYYAKRKHPSRCRVKTRSSLDFGLPQDFVKPKNTITGKSGRCMNEGLGHKCRFDIIAIHKESKSFAIEHL
jgi:putative endonuclease